jgi:hypothetical protein
MRLKALDKPAFHLAVIALLGLIVYSNTFNVPFLLDDHRNIVDNRMIKDLSYYIDPAGADQFAGATEYPMFKSRYVGSLTFALNYRVHGLDVRGYHAVNIAIHIVNALLVYWLVLLTFMTPFMRESRLKDYSRHIALFSALLFVAHPVQTQAVTYIIQRFASLATMFYMLSLVLYIRCRLCGALNSKSAVLYALALISAVLAIKTKETAFTLPVMVALYEFLFFGGSLRKRFLYLLPLLLTMLIIPLTLLGADRPFGEIIGGVGEATRLRAEVSRADYLFTQFRVIATYIRLMFLPVNQNLDYDYPVFHSLLNPQVILSFVLLISLVVFGSFLLHRSRASEPVLRLLSFGIFWFFITLSVESSIIPIKDIIFEHRLYLPGVAFLPAFVVGIFYATEKLGAKKIFTVTAAICVAVAISFSVAAHSRNAVWKSELSLWRDVLSKSPEKARPHTNIGNAYLAKGMADKAIEHYQIALRLPEDITDPVGDYNYSKIHYNLGKAYASKRLLDIALRHYRTAITLDPRSHRPHFAIGVIYLERGFVYEARAKFETAQRLNPHDGDAAKFLKYISRLEKQR